jgi:FAD/FMN-containing dehydrogenase
MSRVASGATAFAHRDAGYMVSVIAGWESGDDAPTSREWVLQNWAGLRPAARGVYVNFLGDEGAARIREAYPGATYERLVAIKRKYDPMNLFRQNQNINPA